MEDLLAHRQWVRALARRLAADESGADDLEQATWLAAVEHPPRHAASLRGWLSAVMRNVRRNERRGDFRRDARERTVARPEVAGAAPDVVAEAEEQTILVREVLALDEPYRSTALLRWFQDMTPDAIAARQGVPIETVRTRLKRAVARLRERMDARHGGDRKAWCLLLLGRGDGWGTGAAEGGTSAALTGAAGGAAMGMATKFAAAAVVVAALGAGAWWMQRGAPPPVGAPSKGETADAAASGRRARHGAKTDDGASSETATLDLSKVDRDLDLHGVLVRTDGSPVVGAKVQAVDYPWRRTMTMDVDALFESVPGVATKSDAAGAFALRLRRGEATNVRVAADGLATLEVGPYQAGGRVRIVMSSAVTLRVSLKDEVGSPVAGASLWVMGGGRGDQPWVNARATTDAAGTTAFGGLPGGAAVAILPLAGAGDFGASRVTLPATGETSLDLVSPTGRTIRGRVFDAVSLAPIQDAKVGLGKGMICATTTDGGGRFEIRGFTGKNERSIEVFAAGHSPAVVAVAEVDSVEIPLRAGFAATGRVVDATGAPVAGAFVAVEASNRIGSVEQFSCGRAVAGADGRFRVGDLDRTMAHVVTAFASGRARARKLVAPPRDMDSIDCGDVVLGVSRAIEGVVLRPDGTASRGVDVRLVGPDAGGATEPGSTETRRTDDLGRFRFRDLSPGQYEVTASNSGATDASAKVSLAADRDVLDVVLPPKPNGGGIVVRVTDETGAPVPGVVVMGRAGTRSDPRATTDASGRAELEKPERGFVRSLQIGSPSLDSDFVYLPPIQVERARSEYAVTMEHGAFVECRLLDPDGRPLARASLGAEPSGRVISFRLTDADGRLRLVLPRQGEFAITFAGGVYGAKGLPEDSLLEAKAEHVTAQSGSVVLRCTRVATGRTAVVRVVEADGSPQSDAVVRLFAASGLERKAKTDAEGRARFDDLPAREFHASVEGYRSGTLPVPPKRFVPEGQEVTLARPAGVPVSGRVAWSTGEPVQSASLVVLRGEPYVFMGGVDRDGRFTVQVPSGDDGPFTLVVTAMDGKRAVDVQVPFSPTDGEIHVVVPR